MSVNKQPAQKDDVWIPTACNMCFNACGIKVHRVDGVVVKIEGNPDNPTGSGRICGKGATGIMMLYDPNRITKPLKRTNPKKGLDQDPGWVEISWDEAYEIAATKMKEMMDEDPRYIMAYSSVANFCELSQFVTIMTKIFGTSFFTAGPCGVAVHTHSDLLTGTANAKPDYEYCKYLIQFGTQAGTATRHGTNMIVDRFATAREKGCKLVNVDPRMSGSAEKADIWLPIRPGTDGALAMALAYVLVHELDLYDKEYLKKYTNATDLVDLETGLIVRNKETRKPYIWDTADNQAKTIDDKTIKNKAIKGIYTVDGKRCTPSFAVYFDHLKKFTPEWAEKITTIPASQIRLVAKEFGEAASIGHSITIDGHVLPYRPAAADVFSGVTRHLNADPSVWAIYFLNVLVGSVNVPGGLTSYGPVGFGYPETGKPNWKPAIWEEDNFIESTTMCYPFPQSCYSHFKKPVEFKSDFDSALLELMPMNCSPDSHLHYVTQIDPEPYHQKRSKLLWMYAGNVLKSWGNIAEMQDYLRSYDYMIMCDLYLNDTSYFADLFLPEACYLERFDSPPNEAFNHVSIGSVTTPMAIAIRQPVVAARDNAPMIMDILLELADRLGKLPNVNGFLNFFYSLEGENALDFMKKYKFEEILDHIYKSWAGPEKGLEWFKKNGVLTWPRKVEEMYLFPFMEARIPFYNENYIINKDRVSQAVKKAKIPWNWESMKGYEPLPGWYPCLDHEITDPEYDLFPIYYTNTISVDSWAHINPWIDEVNSIDPYGYTLEMNRATGEAKGLHDGDEIILEAKNGYQVEGYVKFVEGVHPEVIASVAGCMDSQSKFIPRSKSKGVACTNLVEVNNINRYDMVAAGYDMCVRVKVTKKK